MTQTAPTMPAETVVVPREPTLIDKLEAVYNWLREPDYGDTFNKKDLVEWLNRRPSGLLMQTIGEFRKADLLAALSRPAPVAGEAWRDIASAPRDGTKFDGWQRDERVTDMYWSDVQDAWCIDGTYGPEEPTPLAIFPEVSHWMPSPLGPFATPAPEPAAPDAAGLRAALKPFDVVGIPDWGDDEKVYLTCDGQDLGSIALGDFRRLARARSSEPAASEEVREAAKRLRKANRLHRSENGISRTSEDMRIVLNFVLEQEK